MVVDKSITGQFVQDGNERILESVTIPNGEVWRVGTAWFTTEGDGGNDTSIKVRYGVAQPAMLDKAIQYHGRGGGDNIDPTQPGSTGAAGVGAYGVGGEEVRVDVANDAGGGGTVYYTAIMRRVV